MLVYALVCPHRDPISWMRFSLLQIHSPYYYFLSYTNRAILLSPFVPFIVILCHVIATYNKEDLGRLEDFTASMRPLCSFSQPIERLHNLCSVLGTVAQLYIEAKTRSKAGEDQSLASVGQEFDVYLSALGLAPGNAMNAGPEYFPADGPIVQSTVPESSAQASVLSAPVLQPQQLHSTQDPVSIAEMSQATQLGNWFSGNQYMMGLVEEDLFQFIPNV